MSPRDRTMRGSARKKNTQKTEVNLDQHRQLVNLAKALLSRKDRSAASDIDAAYIAEVLQPHQLRLEAILWEHDEILPFFKQHNDGGKRYAVIDGRATEISNAIEVIKERVDQQIELEARLKSESDLLFTQLQGLLKTNGSQQATPHEPITITKEMILPEELPVYEDELQSAVNFVENFGSRHAGRRYPAPNMGAQPEEWLCTDCIDKASMGKPKSKRRKVQQDGKSAWHKGENAKPEEQSEGVADNTWTWDIPFPGSPFNHFRGFDQPNFQKSRKRQYSDMQPWGRVTVKKTPNSSNFSFTSW